MKENTERKIVLSPTIHITIIIMIPLQKDFMFSGWMSARDELLGANRLGKRITEVAKLRGRNFLVILDA